jgi:hypothetical protein
MLTKPQSEYVQWARGRGPAGPGPSLLQPTKPAPARVNRRTLRQRLLELAR